MNTYFIFIFLWFGFWVFISTKKKEPSQEEERRRQFFSSVVWSMGYKKIIKKYLYLKIILIGNSCTNSFIFHLTFEPSFITFKIYLVFRIQISSFLPIAIIFLCIIHIHTALSKIKRRRKIIPHGVVSHHSLSYAPV